ncbi:MAG: DUF2284 domain-containing protein [Synergistaceae bacterium]
MYKTEVITRTLSVSDMMTRYYKPNVFIEACKFCPSYGKLWSCPPDLPPTTEILKGYNTVILSAIKVVYTTSDIILSRTMSVAERNEFKDNTYGVVKATLNEAMLNIEKIIPNSLSVAAGECKSCPFCTRQENKPCRFPEKMRYSFSALGFDITNMSNEVMNLELLWSDKELPEYLTAITALFIK